MYGKDGIKRENIGSRRKLMAAMQILSSLAVSTACTVLCFFTVQSLSFLQFNHTFAV